MERISLFVSIVIIVFGVLQIILFFKLWGMTNNVKKIANKLNSRISWNDQIQIELLKGNKDKAQELLIEKFFIEIWELYVNGIIFYNKKYKDIISRYPQLQDVIDFEKYDSCDKIEELLNK